MTKEISVQPSKINLHPEVLVFDAMSTDMREELNKLHDQIEQRAIETINWYLKRKQRESSRSKALRFFAIMLTSIGTLIPLLQGIPLFESSINSDFDIGQWGYIAFALAASCVGMDRFFGFSSAWMRCMTTEMRLQKSLGNFQMNWIILSSQLKIEQPDDEMRQKMLHLLQSFYLEIAEHIQEEMQLWVNEFHNNLIQLEGNVQHKNKRKS